MGDIRLARDEPASAVPRKPSPRTGWLIGLIGEGIGGSLSPAMHMAEGDAQGCRYIYRIIDLVALGRSVDDLPALLNGAIMLGFDGLNITHPCKQAILPLLDEVDDDALAIGAVNTVRIVGGRTRGYNTDVSGFRVGIERDIGAIRGHRVAQLGAGGAGAATAAAVLSMGATHVAVVDTDVGRAERLAATLCARFGADAATASTDIAAALADAQGLVHATPTGMAAHPGLPLDAALLRPDLWVAEIVYFPLETALLKAARATGCRTSHGGNMAVFQAVGAFEIFTGRKADGDRMMRHFAALTGAGA
ncbi:shikimate dehydrogenase [Sphingomonas prati]|uniref:Shikimate dehydrogenase n=1 Tax=Sphingomonas prati TaxID=1843237 RepID=A0A7W9BUS1_9SPHN|nr:shikimate dehydrogenase [Sphingomonas prati]MBB5730498.1 shikimate dehydrogenase [Sphingomonas prati]GGE94514.1 shikimate dehydrogenase [Sphingomonas prati]